jgi:predicted O-linked N-acetylglucosamine transferase (SPINDLY family)
MNPNASLNDALLHLQSGDITGAQTRLRTLLSIQPNHPDAVHLLGMTQYRSGDFVAAINSIRQAISIRPDCADYYCNLGLALASLKQFPDAVAAYQTCLKLDPLAHQAWYNLGKAFRDMNRPNDAIAAYQRGLTLRPNHPPLLNNLGTVLRSVDRLDEAVAAFRAALAARPDYFEAMNNLANTLGAKGMTEEAVACFRKAVALQPGEAIAQSNLANALVLMGDLDGAVQHYQQAVALRPDSANYHCSLASSLFHQGQLDEAIASYDRAMQIQPHYGIGHDRLFVLHFHPGYDAIALLREHRRWEAQFARPLYPLGRPHGNDRSPDRRLRIGYVSADFRVHVVGWMMRQLLAAHDREQVEVFCYSSARKPDATTAEIQAVADQWRDIRQLNHEQAAAMIRQDQIDILIDLSLHSAGSRLLMFACKPAPVQAVYLGGLGTSGMEAIDYRLSDWQIDPADSDLGVYSEKTIRLPHTYWCYQPSGPAPEVGEAPMRRNGHVTFGCLNSFFKCSPPTLDLFARILAQVPRSRMLLNCPAGSCRERALGHFERAGVTADRIEFTITQPWPVYIQTYHKTDIALDPFPYGGASTSCDALWMGVPVITLSGRTAAGRGGRSILSTIGLPELVASSPDEYARIAGEYERWIPLRRTLRARMAASPLMDARGFARDIEAAYRTMWRSWI